MVTPMSHQLGSSMSPPGTSPRGLSSPLISGVLPLAASVRETLALVYVPGAAGVGPPARVLGEPDGRWVLGGPLRRVVRSLSTEVATALSTPLRVSTIWYGLSFDAVARPASGCSWRRREPGRPSWAWRARRRHVHRLRDFRRVRGPVPRPYVHRRLRYAGRSWWPGGPPVAWAPRPSAGGRASGSRQTLGRCPWPPGRVMRGRDRCPGRAWARRRGLPWRSFPGPPAVRPPWRGPFRP